ncbi:MAG: imidazole glycerol phosphate synthase subunit HisH [Candidatus Omnitrophota bacterium]|nr:imidazole glycerol phosphate synthase subunit HisH [Candidatus Omnitrophota bacterium]
MIIIIDYGMGNLRSVAKAAEFLGKTVRVTDSVSVIKKAKKIIFPGVGHFGKAVQELKKRNIYTLLKERIKEGVPFLGICLGMQLLLTRSDEARTARGLSVITGQVKKFSARNLIVPHMGWNSVKFQVPGSRAQAQRADCLFKRIKDGSFFYFAHSYYCAPTDKKTILATTDYGVSFTCALHKDNVWGVQFHPEKSQALGLRVFNNFLEL